ncbi:hypothetical protein CEP53_014438 [Fusarium sp. AF-6]|nr:hypothetical protein CEP53_014438 [Fusarium sp. AF-6]
MVRMALQAQNYKNNVWKKTPAMDSKDGLTLAPEGRSLELAENGANEAQNRKAAASVAVLKIDYETDDNASYGGDEKGDGSNSSEINTNFSFFKDISTITEGDKMAEDENSDVAINGDDKGIMAEDGGIVMGKDGVTMKDGQAARDGFANRTILLSERWLKKRNRNYGHRVSRYETTRFSQLEL